MATNTAGRIKRRSRRIGVRIIEPLNDAVSQLIKENRTLKRQVSKLSSRSGPDASGADRRLELLKRRVQRALGETLTRKRRPAAR
jgi:hypothetical protein